MVHKTRTKDEKFIVSLYEAALNSGEMDTPFNRYEMGNLAGLHPKGVDAICKLLIQANFVKKAGESQIYITKNGEELALRLLQE